MHACATKCFQDFGKLILFVAIMTIIANLDNNHHSKCHIVVPIGEGSWPLEIYMSIHTIWMVGSFPTFFGTLAFVYYLGHISCRD